jgi:hypothetical protein
MFDLGATAKRGGKQAGTATDYIARVPAFPEATVAEVLDIRSELKKPLVRFRLAIADLSRKIESAAQDEDFEAEVSEVFAAEVEPALLELQELAESNTYLQQLLGRLGSDAKALIGGSTMLSIGLIGMADLSAVVAASVSTGAALTTAAAEAAVARHRQRDDVERDRLFLLYRTQELLAQ